MANEKRQGNKNKGKSLYLDLSFVGTLIFLLFRIPLTNIIGNEGNGYFSVSWELYTLFGLLFGLGISNVTSEMIRKRFRKNQYQNAASVLTASLLAGLVMSLIGAAVIYFISDFLLGLISMQLSGISFRFIAILLLFGTIAGVFRGYFEGTGTNVPTCFSNIVEAFVAGTGAVIFTVILNKYGTKVGALLFNAQYEPAFGAAGIVAGCICGSIFALLFLFVINHIYQIPLRQLLKKDESRGAETLKSILPEMSKLFLITLAELLFFKIFRTVNMWLYIKTTVATDSKGKIVQYLGSYHGKVLVLTGIVILIILSLSGRNTRRIQRYYFKNEYKPCWKYFCEDFKQIILLSVPFVILLAVLAKNIFTLFYKTAGNIEVTMLQIGSINIILIPAAIYMYRLLGKMDLKMILIIIPAVAFIAQTIIMYVIVKIPTVGALSMIISEVSFWLFIVIMEALVALKTLKQGFKSKI